MLIAICGIDGSGKTTQIQMLQQYFSEKKTDIYLTKQPTSFYRQYDRFRDYVNGNYLFNDKTILYELALLSAADKIRHYETEILPNNNRLIISDRYVFSAYAYFIARGINDIEWLTSINKFLPLPDLTIYLDIDPEIAFDRIVSRDGRYTKKEETNIKLLEKVRQVFLSRPWGEISNYNVVFTSDRNKNDIHNELVKIIEATL